MNLEILVKQLLIRLLGETPIFWKSLRWVMFATLIIGAIPQGLEWLCSQDACSWVPTHALVLIGKIVSISASVGAFISSLAVTEGVKTKMGIKD